MNPLPIDSPCQVNGITGQIVAVLGDGTEYFVRLPSGAFWFPADQVRNVGKRTGQLVMEPVPEGDPDLAVVPQIRYLTNP